MPTYKNIMLVGASGSIGKIILHSLLANPEFAVTVLSRKDSEVSFPSGVAVRKSDFSPDDLQSAFTDQDVVISAVGAAGFGEQEKLVDAAVAAGVQRFLPSEFSTSSQDGAVQKLLPIFAIKSKLIEHLKTKESASFSWTGVATSGLFDWGLANGFLEFDIPQKKATVWDDGERRFTLINEQALGNSVVGVLRNPEETRNRYLYVASVETSQNEIVAALEEATGSAWDIRRVSTDTQVDEATKLLANGDFNGALTLVRATVFANIPDLRSNYAKVEKLANETLGIKMEDVKEVVQRVVKAAA